MSSSEFAEWMAYDRLEPFGPQRDDLRAGMIAAPIIRTLGGKRISPDTWVLDFTPASMKPDMDDEHMKLLLKGFAERAKRKKGG